MSASKLMSQPTHEPVNSPPPATLTSVEPGMVCIPEGWFEMGCATGRDDEKPVHRVWVDAFQIAACQVTRAEYTHFLAATGKAPPRYWDDPNFQDAAQPVVGPSWFEARTYCEWLSAVSGCAYRLPTEAEWERAAGGHTIPLGRRAARILARLCCSLEDRSGTGGTLRAECIRPVQHGRQCARMVRRLVRRALLRDFSGA